MAIHQYILIFYVLIYILFHLPFDILMLIKKKSAKYPNAPFESFFEGFFFVVPSLGFWFYLFIAPLYSLIKKQNIFNFEYFPDRIILWLRIFGAILLSVGLLIACLGRIGRNFYLARETPILATNWGHVIVRHPEYFMYITGFIGLPLLTLQIFLLPLLFGIWGYIRTIKHEEDLLIQTFGLEYQEYMKKVGALFPKFRKN